MKAKASMAVYCALVLSNFSCGSKDDGKKPEEVEIKNLTWIDNKSTLSPDRWIAIDGEVVSNANSVVTLTLVDEADRPIKQNDNTVSVAKQSPPAGKEAFSLHKDMDIKVYAGPEACNGSYVLKVQVVAGRSNIVKPLYFKVVDGKTCTPQLELTSDVKKGSVHNVLGPKEGAYDLIKGETVAKNAGDETKDLKDITNVGSRTAGGGFRKVLSSGNHARFIVDNSVGFDAVTAESARTLFTRNPGDRLTPALRVNDVVYVKLAQQREGAIYALRITRVDASADPSDRGTNAGVIEFDYRKVSQ